MIGLQISVTAIDIDDLYQSYAWPLPVSCVHEQKAVCICIVGTVDRRGYGGQQKGTIVTLVDRIPRFDAHLSQFFAEFD